jgi:hypothetical protein
MPGRCAPRGSSGIGSPVASVGTRPLATGDPDRVRGRFPGAGGRVGVVPSSVVDEMDRVVDVSEPLL